MMKKDDNRATLASGKIARRKAKLEFEAKQKAREAAVIASLYQPPKPVAYEVKKLLDFARVPETIFSVPFIAAVVEKAPRLLTLEWVTALHTLWVAASYVVDKPSVDGWRPKAKGSRSVFQQLAKHLLERYPQPVLLWTALEEKYGVAIKLAPLVAQVAQGGSLFKSIPGLLPVPLSKKQCHALLTTPCSGFLLAIRTQQVLEFGGSHRLAEMWVAGRGAELMRHEDEVFWATVLAFFAKTAMLDLSHIGPLGDYIAHRRANDRGFSMKGRTAEALLRDMEEWHQTLNRKKAAGTSIFESSGFLPCSMVRTRTERGVSFTEEWRIDEILSGKDLAEEGRALKHCVSSYSYSIQSRRVSIWSMTCGGSRSVTIEVLNQERKIVQVRGRYNRISTTEEFRVLNAWAQTNHLSISNHL